ncbi:UreF-domain-containing protein [Xylariaceae sp. FL1019]|nr:UreF-domain-containing protein [Xylariaceae sp. FL1019]
MHPTDADESTLEHEIANLESQLHAAKSRLNARRQALSPSPSSQLQDTSHHYLLLLSDSALPLGSFAFSSGLESYIAHSNSLPSYRYKPSFPSFLPLSLSSYASTTLPFVLAAHRFPDSIPELDDALDASIICAVGRRASVAQGRALLSIWEKSLSLSSAIPPSARSTLSNYSSLLRSSTYTRGGGDDLPPPVSAHLAPLFGAVCAILGLTLHQTAYIFLLSHAKALVSAAVRASMFGPYQAQKVLAGGEVQTLIHDMVQREWDTRVEDAGQSVPVMDLWIGRHEMLYSRIFNS